MTNDTALLSVFYGTHHPRLASWLRQRLSLTYEEAEDLSSEVFLRALRALPAAHTPHTAETMETWLWTIARNLAIDTLRAWGRRPVPIPLDDYDAPDGSNPEAQVLRQYEVERVKVVARQVLSPAQAEVLSMAYGVEEPSNEEIAAAMGRRQGAVRQMRYKAVQALRVALEA